MRDNGYSTCLRGKIVFTPPRRSFFVHRILHIRIIHCQNNSFHVTLKFFPIYSIPIYLHLASAFFFHLNKRFSITRNRFANRSLNHRRIEVTEWKRVYRFRTKVTSGKRFRYITGKSVLIIFNNRKRMEKDITRIESRKRRNDVGTWKLIEIEKRDGKISLPCTALFPRNWANFLLITRGRLNK